MSYICCIMFDTNKKNINKYFSVISPMYINKKKTKNSFLIINNYLLVKQLCLIEIK